MKGLYKSFMLFVYNAWENFCAALEEKGIFSIPAKEARGKEAFLVLKHDIETNVAKAYRVAEIESRHGHRGVYYAHAYLLNDPKNVELLKEMQQMGHEISYHHDVMDSNKGDLEAAIGEFQTNIKRFETMGFPVSTVCQHGNPIVERKGYTSNRDFFRSERVQWLFPNIADIMVDFGEKYQTDYSYYSDAGRKFHLIYDPINNDIIPSDEKNVPYEDLNALLGALPEKAIISTHPHRWSDSAVVYLVKEKGFHLIKNIAKLLVRLPLMKRLMSRYYYLAKKI